MQLSLLDDKPDQAVSPTNLEKDEFYRVSSPLHADLNKKIDFKKTAQTKDLQILSKILIAEQHKNDNTGLSPSHKKPIDERVKKRQSIIPGRTKIPLVNYVEILL